MQTFILILLGLHVGCRLAKVSLDGQLCFRLSVCLSWAPPYCGLGPGLLHWVQAEGTVLGHVLMVYDPKRRPSLLVWVPPKANPETRIGCSQLIWKVIPGSTSEGVAKWVEEERKAPPQKLCDHCGQLCPIGDPLWNRESDCPYWVTAVLGNIKSPALWGCPEQAPRVMEKALDTEIYRTLRVGSCQMLENYPLHPCWTWRWAEGIGVGESTVSGTLSFTQHPSIKSQERLWVVLLGLCVHPWANHNGQGIRAPVWGHVFPSWGYRVSKAPLEPTD